MSEHKHHISTLKQLISVGVALIILTILTVAISAMGLPSPLNLIVALSIALIKACLVAAFFMGLYWDSKFNSMLLIGAIMFFVLMFSVTLLDTMFRNDPIPAF